MVADEVVDAPEAGAVPDVGVVAEVPAGAGRQGPGRRLKNRAIEKAGVRRACRGRRRRPAVPSRLPFAEEDERDALDALDRRRSDEQQATPSWPFVQPCSSTAGLGSALRSGVGHGAAGARRG